MNIWGVVPNPNTDAVNVKSASKSTTNINYKGPSFAQSMGEIAKSAQIQVAHGATASELEFKKEKGVLEKPFDFEDAEEDLIDDYISRIKRMMEDLKK